MSSPRDERSPSVPSTSFRAATAVEPVAGRVAPPAPGATATYVGMVHSGWDIYGNANGGYLVALVVRAMQDWIGRPPVTVTTHFLSPGTPGPVRIEMEAIRVGGRFATARATLWHEDRQLLEVLGAVGASQLGGFAHSDLTPPELPPFEDPSVRASAEELAVSPAIFSMIDARMTPESSGFRRGEPSGVGESVGWLSFGDESVDEAALMLAADVFPPPLFNLDGPAGWVPTVELTVHVRRRPEPGPLRCRFVTSHIGDGLVGEDGEVWDSADNLVCQSRQLALVPRG